MIIAQLIALIANLATLVALIRLDRALKRSAATFDKLMNGGALAVNIERFAEELAE